jgi:hypothetical protein
MGTVGWTKAQVVSRLLFTAEALVDAQVIPCGSYG